jgi:hypothetical protein
MSLQQNVADSIAHEIQAKLTPQENLRQAQNRQVDPEAYVQRWQSASVPTTMCVAASQCAYP